MQVRNVTEVQCEGYNLCALGWVECFEIFIPMFLLNIITMIGAITLVVVYRKAKVTFRLYIIYKISTIFFTRNEQRKLVIIGSAVLMRTV